MPSWVRLAGAFFRSAAVRSGDFNSGRGALVVAGAERFRGERSWASAAFFANCPAFDGRRDEAAASGRFRGLFSIYAAFFAGCAMSAESLGGEERTGAGLSKGGAAGFFREA